MIQWDGPAPIRAMQYSPDSMYLAVVCANGVVLVLDAFFVVVTQDELPAFTTPCGICWRPDSLALEVFQGQHVLELPVSVAGLNRTRITTMETRRFADAVWAGSHLQAVVDGNYLRLFDTKLGKFTNLSQTEQHGFKHLTAHPASKTLAWTTNQRMMRTWRYSTPTKFDVGIDKLVGPVGFAPDGLSVAVGADWNIRIYPLNQKLPKCELTGHQGRVTALAYQASGQILLSCSWDQTVRYWDVGQAREIAKFPLSIGVLNTLSLAPDGTRVAVGGSDGNLVVIDLE
jgi:WD domain, G-beta repeat